MDERDSDWCRRQQHHYHMRQNEEQDLVVLACHQQKDFNIPCKGILSYDFIREIGLRKKVVHWGFGKFHDKY